MGGHTEAQGHGQGHGHGGHGHGDAHKFTVPDWKEYKINGIKELEWTQKSLASKGLRDPWLRNEVWRYKYWPGFGKNALWTFFRGFKYAAAAMVITIGVDQLLGISKSKQHHGDHHGDDAAHH